ncbi:ribonuclease H-like domain-containing protein [Xylaria bambusicola]|uniref:ribonuclease H-like domain-containing protein n=1 Tax=Xylaria bambusicola TaxID=326684 RepID=UPI00200768FE|nr:ribonuclease H-like domain-containing protein [Xylaria bambusicola]KAI0506407.1 ribonuclease H-like domain-containing protein [Xylaria bambusicola]
MTMDSSQDFKSLQESIQNALVSTTRLANQIAAEDLSFQRTSNPAVAEELDDTSSRLLALTTSLLQSATKGTDVTGPNLDDADDVDVHWSRIVDVLDNLLEKADTSLDEYTGAIKRKAPAAEHHTAPAKKSRYALDQSIRRANVLKPQNTFELKPNNLDTSPWKPILTKKPHATLALDKSIESFTDESQSTQYKHPYETEIRALEYPESIFQPKEPIRYLPFESTTATFVDTFDGVLAMLDELKGATEIAIDTEHHDFRTYTGLLSLMQISTREKDWIVDTLQPWRHKLEVLNEVFADPSIIKVLHGAYMDIVWLQRDCGLYIVGLFDTFEAACALQYPGRSLAYLLKRFVDFDADKKYQLADWRIRPIPEEMFYYARSDTHYLLYIYDNLRNELLSSTQSDMSGHDLMRLVLDKSKETSLRRHESFIYDTETGQGPFGWFNMLIRQSAGKFSKEQFAVFRAIHQWRDKLARKEDESPLFIMNNATVFDIARRLPPDPKALHGLLDSGSFLAKREVSTLFEIITKAKEQGADGPSVAEVIRGNAPATMGIGEVARSVLPQLKDRAKDALDAKDLVSHSSRLWGGIPISSRWDSQHQLTFPKQSQFELPWAQFVQSAKLADDVTQEPSQDVDKSENMAIEAAPNEATNGDSVPEDGEFTLKAVSKRKAPESDDSSESDDEAQPSDNFTELAGSKTKTAPGSSEEEIAVPDEDDSEQEKKARKANKKALRLARKAEKRQQKDRQRAEKRAMHNQNSASAGKDGAEENDEPFDYSKAKSILKADNAKANNTSGTRKAKFNPYALTAEGPKPARRMHGERAGKSATWKS